MIQSSITTHFTSVILMNSHNYVLNITFYRSQNRGLVRLKCPRLQLVNIPDRNPNQRVKPSFALKLFPNSLPLPLTTPTNICRVSLRSYMKIDSDISWVEGLNRPPWSQISWSQDPVTVSKFSRTLGSSNLRKLYLLIFTILEIKTKNQIFINTFKKSNPIMLT